MVASIDFTLLRLSMGRHAAHDPFLQVLHAVKVPGALELCSSTPGWLV